MLVSFIFDSWTLLAVALDVARSLRLFTSLRLLHLGRLRLRSTRVFMIRNSSDAAHHITTSLLVCVSPVTDAVGKSQIRVMCATTSARDSGHTTARSGSVRIKPSSQKGVHR